MEELSWQEAYALLSMTVAPRPIAFVSTISPEGVPNLAPFSFFAVGGSNPPSLAFSPVLGSSGREKDSLRNVRTSGEFVVNLVHRSMADGMNRASVSLPSDTSEWAVGGFTALPSLRVHPARVAESRVQFECRLHQIVEHGEGPGAARYVIGEVLVAHVAMDVLRDGKIDPDLLEPIARLGGSDYIDTGNLQRFALKRP
jgi:flavin reductase (DIM6/NTAB) family NADH-FMN oxidoreductase RutF